MEDKTKVNQMNEDITYKTILNNIDQGFCVIKVIFNETGKPVDYMFIATNPAFEENTGLKNAVGSTMKELNPKHEDYWFHIYGDVAKTGISVHFENGVANLKGGAWYDVYAFRIGNPGDNLVSVFFKDITSQKQLKENLRESETRYKELVSNARTIIIKLDNNARINFMNSYGLDFFGFREEEIVGKIVTETIVPAVESTGRNLDELVEKIFKEPAKYSVVINENIKKNGEKVWIEWYNSSLTSEKGTYAGLISVGIDITESKKNKDALLESEARFRLIAEALPVMVCITRSRDSVVLFTNEVNNRAFGMKGEDIIGTKGQDYYWNPVERQKMIEIFKENGFVDNYLLKVKRANGTPFWIITSVRPIKYQGDDAMIRASIDVTSYRQVEMKLEESQRRLSLAIENGNIGMIEWNRKNNEVLLDERAARMFGVPAGLSVITFDNFEELIHEEDIPLLRNSIEKILSSESSQEALFRIRSGESDYISMRANAVFDEKDMVAGMFGVCLDLSELKRGDRKGAY